MPLMNPLGAAITDSLGAFKEPLIRAGKERERGGGGGVYSEEKSSVVEFVVH